MIKQKYIHTTISKNNENNAGTISVTWDKGTTWKIQILILIKQRMLKYG